MYVVQSARTISDSARVGAGNVMAAGFVRQYLRLLARPDYDARTVVTRGVALGLGLLLAMPS